MDGLHSRIWPVVAGDAEVARDFQVASRVPSFPRSAFAKISLISLMVPISSSCQRWDAIALEKLQRCREQAH
jgi:hypothetical protein